jgi:hypothetical protein
MRCFAGVFLGEAGEVGEGSVCEREAIPRLDFLDPGLG